MGGNNLAKQVVKINGYNTLGIKVDSRYYMIYRQYLSRAAVSYIQDILRKAFYELVEQFYKGEIKPLPEENKDTPIHINLNIQPAIRKTYTDNNLDPETLKIENETLKRQVKELKNTIKLLDEENKRLREENEELKKQLREKEQLLEEIKAEIENRECIDIKKYEKVREQAELYRQVLKKLLDMHPEVFEEYKQIYMSLR